MVKKDKIIKELNETIDRQDQDYDDSLKPTYNKIKTKDKKVSKKIIIFRNSQSPYYYLQGNISKRVFETLRNELSFYREDYQRTDKYKEGLWDGKEVLLYQSKIGDLYFPVGLLKKVCNVLNAFRVEYLIEDGTEIPKNTTGFKKISTMELRPYQKDAVNNVFRGNGGVVSLPTGAGKTVIALQLINAYNLPALILVNTKELLYQWQTAIRNFFGEECGLVGDGNYEFKTITVAMVQTLYNIVSDDDTEINYPLLICDECHRVAAQTVYKVAMNCFACVRIGLSATPRRSDGADLKIWAALGEVCANITPEFLIDNEYLTAPTFLFESVVAGRTPIKSTWNEAYTNLIVRHKDRNEKIIKIANKLVGKGYRTFVSVARVNHGEFLANQIDNAVFFSGKTKVKDRQRILEEFKKGEILCIVSTLLSEGVDIPEMESIILAGGGKSAILAIQRVGRALRRAPNKDGAIIVDFIDKGRYVSDHAAIRLNLYKEYYGKYCKLPSEQRMKKKQITPQS